MSTSREWFREWFGERYLQLYSHRDRAEAQGFVSCWPLWDRLHPGDLALDVGCGAGRYALELAGRALKVLGLDLSMPLLRKAQDALPTSSPGAVWLVRGDMRALPLRPGFKLAVSLFTTFGYFDDRENRALLCNLAQLLQPGGFLVLDVPNRDYVRSRVRREPASRRSVGGVRWREERRLVDADDRVEKRIRINRDGVEESYLESVRLYSRDELGRMLAETGFELLEPVWGDYTGAAMAVERSRMIFFGRTVG